MKHFMKYLGALVLAVVVLGSCQKQKYSAIDEGVSFKVDIADYINKKDLGDFDTNIPECKDCAPDYVVVSIDNNGDLVGDVDYTLDLLSLGDGTITETIMLTPGNYTVTDFKVYCATGELVYVSPREGSHWDNVFNFQNNVPHAFTVLEWQKHQNNIDVLCFEDAEYEKYGFKHFDFHPYKVREKCFFGDVCTKFWEDIANYGDPEINPYFGWPQHYDLHAVYQVEVTNPNGEVSTASNYPFDPQNPGPVCVPYLDDLEVADEVYPFKINLYYPNGTLVTIYEGEFTDEDPNPFGGEDGIFIWSMGDCGVDGIDLIIPPYFPAPSTADVKAVRDPANETYFDLDLQNLDGPFADLSPLKAGSHKGWCFNSQLTINLNTWYKADIYTSFEPRADHAGWKWGVLNWIANHRDQIKNTDFGLGLTDEQKMLVVQRFIWKITNNTDVDASIAGHDLPVAIRANVKAKVAQWILDHASFIPKPGDYAVMYLVPYTGEGKEQQPVQFMSVRIDP